MRKSLPLVFVGLLLLLTGCASSVGAELPRTHKAIAATRSLATTPAAVAQAAAVPASRPPLPAWALPYKDQLVVGVITKQPAVAITIDDVGAPEMKTLVDALVANHLRATLFCVGSKMTTEAAAYAAANGMELGDHSWIHEPLGHSRPEGQNKQIMDTARLLKAGSGEWPIWYRAPFQNLYGGAKKSIADAGMLDAGVSNDPLDYHDVTGKALVSAVSKKLKPGQIILMHHYPATIATLPALAAELRRRNVQALTLSELAQTGDPATSQRQLEPFTRFFDQ